MLSPTSGAFADPGQAFSPLWVSLLLKLLPLPLMGVQLSLLDILAFALFVVPLLGEPLLLARRHSNHQHELFYNRRIW